MGHQKQLLALCLVISMVLAFLPVPTLADEEMPPGMDVSLLESDTDEDMDATNHAISDATAENPLEQDNEELDSEDSPLKSLLANGA